IKSDGKRIILPFVLYMPDTTYSCDVVQWQSTGLFSIMETERRRAGVYSGTDYPVNGLSFLVPASFNGVHDMEFDKRKTKAKGSIMRYSGDMEFTMRKMYVEGQEKITTKAGEFDCY